MHLSETMKAKSWLNQFEENDRWLAEKILEKTTYYTNSDIFIGLKQIVHKVYEPLSEYVAFYPVIDVKTTYESKHYEDYWSEEINSYSPKQDVGSDGEISHIIRDICKTNTYFLNQPTLSELQKKHCHILVFVNDINCSGDQISKFAEWLYDNKTIKSWKSYKKIQFNSICFASTSPGYERLLQNKLIAKNYFNVRINTLDDFEIKYKESLEKLIIKYSSKHFSNSPFSPFGYDEIGSLVLLSYKNPNTNICLFYSNKDNWHGLTDYKARPEEEFSQVTNYDKNINTILDKYDLHSSPPKERTLLSFLILYRYYFNNTDKQNLLKLKFPEQYHFYVP